MTFRYILNHLLLTAVVFLLQVAVLNNVGVYGVGFPMIYVLAVLIIPVKQPAWWVLLAGFSSGLVMDFFADTGGMHAAATTFMAFARLFLLNRLEPQGGYEKEDRPWLGSFRIQWLLLYFILLVFLHHLFYFALEAGTMSQALSFIIKALVSTPLSVFLIMVINLFALRR